MSTNTKLGRVVTYHVRLPPIESQTLWARGLPRSRDKKNIRPIPQCLWPPSCQDVDLLWGAPTNKVSLLFSVKNKKHYIFATIVLIVTNFDKVVTYYKGLPSITPHRPLSTNLCEVTRQIEIIQSSILQQLLSPNFLE